MMGSEPRGAGVGSHGGRSIAGGNACHARHPQTQRLRGPASHPVIFERTGGIVALVLEYQPVEPAVLSGLARLEQWCIALAQRDHAVVSGKKRNEFAVAPNPALVEGRIGKAPFAPGPFQHQRGLFGRIVDCLEQASAARAIIKDVGDGEPRAALLRKAG